MDYKKKLRLAKEALDSGSYDRETIEYIFPELAESEDERISREITEFILTHRIDEPNDIEDTNPWLVWLEKQGEPKWSEEDERMMKFCISRIQDELEALRNNNFAHQEILQDLKEGCRERIDWLEDLKKRMEE